MLDDGFATATSAEQNRVETSVFESFKEFEERNFEKKGNRPKLVREFHVSFLSAAMETLPRSFQCLDASRPWFCFWISQALDVLGAYDSQRWADRTVSFLSFCRDPITGGFGGGPMQLAHLATTYASVCALAIANTGAARDVINRFELYEFLMSLKDRKSGGFRMHHDGETDMRGTYCAVSVASMTGILTEELLENVPNYILSCQTFEGGFAGDSGGLEAHGGYSYCALATLGIISRRLGADFFTPKKEKFEKLLWWLCQRQMEAEGGFNGRANKLVDSCYSFWQGASLVILRDIFTFSGWPVVNGREVEKDMSRPDCSSIAEFWFTTAGLESYVLGGCQNCGGGLRDKPGKNPDYYHTCYALSGLAVTMETDTGDAHGLRKTHPLYNCLPSKLQEMKAWADLENSREPLGETGWF